MDDFFSSTGFESGGILNLTPRQALTLCQKGAFLIDVREEYMNRFKMLDVPETIYCPFSILEETYRHLPLDKPMIFVDSSGIHSKDAVNFLKEKGFGSLIANLAGGLVEWERDEMPVIIDKSEQLSGSCMCQLRPRNKKD
ncbi:MAG: rhodanese-like domain-containing protein [Bacteroidetes bacterium]|nr:rhodanese-like domain-containing protein [Bacteroidota bacterium]